MMLYLSLHNRTEHGRYEIMCAYVWHHNNNSTRTLHNNGETLLIASLLAIPVISKYVAIPRTFCCIRQAVC